jgi:hypothetical protein
VRRTPSTFGGKWLKRPPFSKLTLPEEITAALMTLTPQERTVRAIVNEAVRTQSSPLRPAGSEISTACQSLLNRPSAEHL